MTEKRARDIQQGRDGTVYDLNFKYDNAADCA